MTSYSETVMRNILLLHVYACVCVCVYVLDMMQLA